MKRLRLDQPFGSLLRTNSGAGLAFPLCHFPAMGRRPRIRPSWCSLWLTRNANGRAVVPCLRRSAARQAGLREQIAEWTKQRGKSPRLYPGSLVWCFKKPGRDLREKVELWLAWKRVAREVAEGTLGGDFDRADRAEIQSKVTAAEEVGKDEVWGG